MDNISGNLVSIVVPVYNVEQYLKKCVNSLLKQTYNNIEIILVDDGSTDNSGIICDSYKYENGNIQVFHKTNGGLSDARNFGIKKCNGDYVIFVDGDDFVSEFHVEYLFSLIKNSNAQIGVANIVCIDENEKVLSKHRGDGKIKIFDTETALGELLSSHSFSNSASAKIYDIKLFDEIEFPVGRLYEDVATIYKLFMLSDKVAYGNKDIYFYLYRFGSISRQSYNEKKSDLVYFTEKMVEDVVYKYPNLERLGKYRLFDGYLLALSQCGDKKISTELIYKLRNMSKSILRDSDSGIKRKICALSVYFGDSFIKWKIH